MKKKKFLKTKYLIIICGAILTLLIICSSVATYAMLPEAMKALDLDKKVAAQAIQQAIDIGDYEEANRLYVQTQSNPPIPGTSAYKNLEDVKYYVEYYRKYREAKDIFHSKDQNKDWTKIVDNLKGAPLDFKYISEVEEMLSRANDIYSSTSTITTSQPVLKSQKTNNNNITVPQGSIYCEYESGKWVVLEIEECKKRQQDYMNSVLGNRSGNNSNQIGGGFPCTTIFGTYTAFSLEACNQLKEQATALQKSGQSVVDSINKMGEISNRTFQPNEVKVNIPTQTPINITYPSPTCVPVGNSEYTICGL